MNVIHACQFLCSDLFLKSNINKQNQRVCVSLWLYIEHHCFLFEDIEGTLKTWFVNQFEVCYICIQILTTLFQSIKHSI